MIDRRAFLKNAAAGAGVAMGLTGCRELLSRGVSLDMATLRSRPSTPTETVPIGFSELGLGRGRDGLLYVPPTYSPDTPSPLLVLLHGGGGRSAEEWQEFDLGSFVDEHGVIVLAPSSRGITWEIFNARPYGADVEFIDDALAVTFRRCNIAPGRIALGGFSDGASEAVSLGITNGDLFSALFVFSPGYFKPAAARGRPRVFLSHGSLDTVLPVEVSRNLVRPWLLERDYDVEYREFDAGHAIHGTTFRNGLAWLASA